MPYESLTQKTLQSIAGKIKTAMANKGLDNTGQASASLVINGNQLLGNEYIYYLDQGRGPGKFPPVTNLQAWVREKLGLESTEAKQVAFLIGRKISREGTDIYKNKSLGLELEEIIDESINELLKELPDEVAAEALTWL